MDSQIKNLLFDEIIHGDAREVLPSIPANSLDLIITSPPYADSRRNTYGGIHPDDYVNWFLPISEQLFKVLKPSGSFVLNIKEKAVNGERHTYVLELIISMRKQGWRWVEEYCWHKKNCHPGKWPNRFRDAWERCLHFTKSDKFKMNQEAVMIPVGEWSQKRLKQLSDNDQMRFNSRSKSGFGKNVSHWVGREYVYPTNVLHLATVCNNKEHSAAFPEALPEWFIQLFTDPGDVVLDPFLGSGTTALAAANNHRHYIGIEIVKEYCELAQKQLDCLKKERNTPLFETIVSEMKNTFIAT